MLLDELKTRLEAIGSTLTFPIRLGFLPTDIVECIVLRETGGTGAELGLGVDGIYLEHPTVSVEARGKPEDYTTPRTQLEAAFQDLPKVQAEELSGTLYHLISARQAPFLAYMDEKRRPVIMFTIDVTKVPS